MNADSADGIAKYRDLAQKCTQIRLYCTLLEAMGKALLVLRISRKLVNNITTRKLVNHITIRKLFNNITTLKYYHVCIGSHCSAR